MEYVNEERDTKKQGRHKSRIDVRNPEHAWDNDTFPRAIWIDVDRDAFANGMFLNDGDRVLSTAFSHAGERLVVVDEVSAMDRLFIDDVWVGAVLAVHVVRCDGGFYFPPVSAS